MKPNDTNQATPLLQAASKRPWDVINGRKLLHIEVANTGDGSPCGQAICSLTKARNADANLIVMAVNLFEVHEAVASAAEDCEQILNGMDLRPAHQCSATALQQALSALKAKKGGV